MGVVSAVPSGCGLVTVAIAITVLCAGGGTQRAGLVARLQDSDGMAQQNDPMEGQSSVLYTVSVQC